MYTCTYDCIKIMYELPLQTNGNVSELFLHKLGGVRIVDWVFVIGLSPRR